MLLVGQYAYSMILLLLMVMLAMSIRLLMNARKRVYYALTLSLFLVFISYITGVFALKYPESFAFNYAFESLKLFSFLFLCWSLLELHTLPRRHMIRLFLFLTFISIVACVVVLFPNSFFGLPDNLGVWRLHLQSAFLIILSLVMSFRVAAFMGNYMMMKVALIVFSLSEIVGLYVKAFPKIPNYFMWISSGLSILFFYLLCILIFSRIVGILNSVALSAVTDGLTGVFIRKEFNKKLAEYISYNLPVSVIFSDIDNFKRLNDTKGHHMGDEMLKKVASILKEEGRGIGIAGRYGGEELLLLVADPSVNIAELAEKIRVRIQTESIVTASIGYSTYVSGVSPDELVRQADEAMYAAKTTGKNKVVAFPDAAKVKAAAAAAGINTSGR